MQASLFLGQFTSPIQALQNYVGFRGLAYGHHFYLLALYLNYLREWALADLALKFGKVIRGRDVIYLFFDFAVNPLAKAANVDLEESALAHAR